MARPSPATPTEPQAHLLTTRAMSPAPRAGGIAFLFVPRAADRSVDGRFNIGQRGAQARVTKWDDVRRDKARIFRGCDPRPATGSLRPKAMGAAVEVTRPPEPSMQRVVQWLREQASRNASER